MRQCRVDAWLADVVPAWRQIPGGTPAQGRIMDALHLGNFLDFNMSPLEILIRGTIMY